MFIYQKKMVIQPTFPTFLHGFPTWPILAMFLEILSRLRVPSKSLFLWVKKCCEKPLRKFPRILLNNHSATPKDRFFPKMVRKKCVFFFTTKIFRFSKAGAIGKKMRMPSSHPLPPEGYVCSNSPGSTSISWFTNLICYIYIYVHTIYIYIPNII